MKKILITIIISTFILHSFGQGKSEFKYFSLKVGVTHGMFNKQPGDFSYLFHETPIGDMQMLPTESFFDYVPGYYAGLVYNYDLRNDKVGLVIGVDYTNYGLAMQYKTADERFSLVQKHSVSRVSIPVYIKLGNRYYDKQNYVYFGLRYDRNLLYSRAEQVNWTGDVALVNPGTDMLKKQNFTAVAGINYMFLNFEFNYVIGGFLNKDYSVFLYDGNIPVKPYENYPTSNMFISTGFNVPFNSWSSRQVYLFNMWFRRVFK